MNTVTKTSTFKWPRKKDFEGSSDNIKSKSYRIEIDYNDEEFVGYYNVSAVVRDNTNNEEVGIVEGAIIHRPNDNFYQEADTISQEYYKLCTAFCNSNGIANQFQHDKLDQEAINNGGFFNISHIEISPEYGGQDLGLRVLHELLLLLFEYWTLAVIIPTAFKSSKCHWSHSCKIPQVFCDTEIIRDPTIDEIKERELWNDKITRQISRVGFVQSGMTTNLAKVWFLTLGGYFNNVEKESRDPQTAIDRWLTKEQVQNLVIHRAIKKQKKSPADMELARLIAMAPLSTNKIQIVQAIEELVLQKGASIQSSQALHAAASLADNINYNHTRGDDDEDYDPYLLQTLIRLGGNVNEPDEKGDTPLHKAVTYLRSRTVKYLIDEGKADPTIENMSGYTPVQLLLRSIFNLGDGKKTKLSSTNNTVLKHAPKVKHVLPRFDCLKALLPSDHVSQLIHGWMSPRMHRTLLLTSQSVVNSFQDVTYNLLPRAEYIPTNVLQSRHDKPSFRVGWENIWITISNILKETKIPTVDAIQKLVDTNKYNNFLTQGGRIDYAIDALIDITRNIVVLESKTEGCECSLSNNNYPIDSNADDPAMIASLPLTEFDKCFDLAWVMCIENGGGELTCRGPFSEPRIYGTESVDDNKHFMNEESQKEIPEIAFEGEDIGHCSTRFFEMRSTNFEDDDVNNPPLEALLEGEEDED